MRKCINTTCSICITLLVYMFSRITIWSVVVFPADGGYRAGGEYRCKGDLEKFPALSIGKEVTEPSGHPLTGGGAAANWEVVMASWLQKWSPGPLHR